MAPRETQFLPVLLLPPVHTSQHAPGLAACSRDCVTTISHGSALCANTHTQMHTHTHLRPLREILLPWARVKYRSSLQWPLGFPWIRRTINKTGFFFWRFGRSVGACWWYGSFPLPFSLSLSDRLHVGVSCISFPQRLPCVVLAFSKVDILPFVTGYSHQNNCGVMRNKECLSTRPPIVCVQQQL